MISAVGLGSCAHAGAPPAHAAGDSAATGPLPRFCTREECAVVVAHNVETDACECDARRMDESFGARMDVVFDVPPGGGTAHVTVGRAISVPEPLKRCVLDRAANWTFPPPGGGAGTQFRAGIIFAPGDSGPCAAPPNAASRQARVDKERARLALLAQRGEVKACFQSAAGSAPLVEARAVVTVLLNRDGRVIQAEVDDSTVADQKVDACIVEKALGWQLPKPNPPGVITLSYPYAFAPGD